MLNYTIWFVQLEQQIGPGRWLSRMVVVGAQKRGWEVEGKVSFLGLRLVIARGNQGVVG